ncbi:SWIM zinc finger family protein [Streptomyces sp. NRRL S-813]|uniref:SWIM zinc finger family protein n=1 Tax=Streptomyces sp. NRRL S-813 TaxID=1463919 RepID=UPI000691F61D|nr:SWIM zinc finger family protein [Streptomyces sp. NRRL S-813]
MQSYTYIRPSALREAAAERALVLETSGGATPAGEEANPRFFSGLLTTPTAAAAALLTVADVAATRYYRPRLPSSLDPVMTANGDRLRMESFSGCCGLYARLEVLAPGLDGGEIGHGTTNVDKVPLPKRWLRGFAEVQVLTAGLALRAEVPASEVAAVLRSLPRPTLRSNARDTRWLVPAGPTLRPASRPVPGAVCLPGPERLHTLQQVLRHSTGLRVYALDGEPGEATAVAWEIGLPGMRLTLVLSQDATRGISGEGAVLHDLAIGTAAQDAHVVSALLAWQPKIDVAELSRQADLPAGRVRTALTVLGTSGQIGCDPAEEAYFHRSLPYSADGAEAHNPRLRGARALVADGAVRNDGATTWVGRGDRVYLVHADDRGELGCPCRWWAKYRGGRGPCKHVLAARMVQDATSATNITNATKEPAR